MLPAQGANFKGSFWATRQGFFFAVPAWHNKLRIESLAPMPPEVLRLHAANDPPGKKQARCAGCIVLGKNNCLVARR
jgi:hypothetical protein